MSSMSSLIRLSLPTRAFPHDKLEEDTRSKSKRPSTLNFGKGLARHRRRITSAWSSLGEKDEQDRKKHTEPTCISLMGKVDSKPLEVRMKNVKPSTTLESNHVSELQETSSDTINTEAAKCIMSLPTINCDSLNVDSPIFPSLEISEIAYASAVVPKQDSQVMSTKSDPVASECLDRVRSISSSYPVEGLPPSPEDRLSPEHRHTSRRSNSLSSFATSYMRIARLSMLRSSTSIYDGSMHQKLGQQSLKDEIIAVGDTLDTNSSAPGTNSRHVSESNTHHSHGTSEHSGVPDSSNKESPYVHFTDDNQSCPELVYVKEDTSTLQVPTIATASEMETETGCSINCSTKTLRPSTDNGLRPSTDTGESLETGASDFTTVHRPSLADGTHATEKSPSLECNPRGSEMDMMPRLQRATPLQSQTSIATTQRSAQYKIRKWVKRVCLRTKTRFRDVMGSSSKNKGKSKAQKTKRAMQRGPKSPVRLKRKKSLANMLMSLKHGSIEA